MTEETSIIQEYFSKLPEYIQDSIISDVWNKKIADIVKRYSLTQSQSVSLQYEITFVVVGMESGGDLVSNIKNELGVSLLLAEQISKDIEKELLSWLDNVQEANTKKEPVKVKDKEPVKIDLKSRILEFGRKILTTNPISLANKEEKQNFALKTKNYLISGNKNELPELVKKIAPMVQDLVLDISWKNRTEEIAKKYSLNPIQTDTLTNNVLFVLVGTDKPEDFLKLVTSELGISRLLADQIIEDLEMRVFEYSLKTIDKATEKQELISKNLEEDTQKQEAKPILPVIEKTKIPEIRPVNLPMVEEGEVARNVPPMKVSVVNKPEYKPSFVELTRPITKNPEVVSRITYSENKTLGEIVQKPLSVPRFTSIEPEISPLKLEVVKPLEVILKPDALNIVNDKLTKHEETLSEPASPQKVVNEAKPVKNYAVDPYRESTE